MIVNEILSIIYDFLFCRSQYLSKNKKFPSDTLKGHQKGNR